MNVRKPRTIDRRTVVRSAAWSLPVVAVAAGAPAAMASAPAEDTYAGIAWDIPASGSSSSWATTFDDGLDGLIATADSVSPGTVAGFKEPALSDTASITVTTTCADGGLSVEVVGGGAPGTYGPGDTVSVATFFGNPDAAGTVTFAQTIVDGFVVGAYIDQTGSGLIDYIALTGATCS